MTSYSRVTNLTSYSFLCGLYLTYFAITSVNISLRLVKNMLKNKKSNPINLNNNAIIIYNNLNISYYIYK